MKLVWIISKHWLAMSIDPLLVFTLHCCVISHLLLEFCLKKLRCTGGAAA